MRKYVAFYEGESLLPVLHDHPRLAAESIASRDAQVQTIAPDGSRKIDELASLTARIVVCEVRPATLSDFFVEDDLISVLRDRMVTRIGNDDALSLIDESLLMEIKTRIDNQLDEIAESHNIRVDGLIVVKRQVARRENLDVFDQA